MEKQAVSASLNKNWRSRYVAIRRDRIEYHAAEPKATHIPRGVVRLSADTIVERVPDYRANWATLRVSDGTTDLYLSAMSEGEMDRWEAKIRETVANADLKQSAPPV